MGTTINIGRVRHANGPTIRRQVKLYLSGTTNISNVTAAAIAAQFQSPSAADAPFLRLAQGSPVDSTDLRHAVRREIDSGQYDKDGVDMLYALLQWALDY